jgi:GntR family transcriptional regulator/MocR family aminotransferase
VVEDDYDHEFHFGSDPLLPMASVAPSRVIYVGSLSKLLLPTLRVGYVAAPPPFIEAVAHRVSITDGMGSVLTEEATAELIESGEVRRHARKAMQVYARRRLAFAETMARRLGGLAETRTPEGGLAFWLRFRDPAVLDRIEARVLGLGLSMANSYSFAACPQADRGLRIGFASLTEAEADRGLAVLASAALPAIVQAAE